MVKQISDTILRWIQLQMVLTIYFSLKDDQEEISEIWISVMPNCRTTLEQNQDCCERGNMKKGENKKNLEIWNQWDVESS
jgi:hypothetical protein